MWKGKRGRNRRETALPPLWEERVCGVGKLGPNSLCLAVVCDDLGGWLSSMVFSHCRRRRPGSCYNQNGSPNPTTSADW
jgi:hypothetical protein